MITNFGIIGSLTDASNTLLLIKTPIAMLKSPKFCRCLLFVVGIYFAQILDAYSQASLASEDIMTNIAVASAPNETFTIVRDARNTKQWYYYPNRPRLVEVQQLNGSYKPEFTLLKYQYSDPAGGSTPLEGAILQFSASLDLPPKILNDLRSALTKSLTASNTSSPTDLNLSALPLNSAEVQLYTPGGEKVTTGNFGSGNAPAISSQKMVFSVDLTRLGANVYSGLVGSQTGIPIVISMKYNGVTPATGFKVTVDWDKTYHHYSTNEIFRARASYFGLFGADASIDKQKIKDVLTQNNCIKVEVTTGSESASNILDKHLEGILARINREMEIVMSPPPLIDPAKASKPNASGYFGGAGYSVAIKNSTNRRTGKETIDFNVRQVIERHTTCGGFIGIGTYTEATRNELITIAPPDVYATAYFLLPTALFDKKLDITSATLEFWLRDAAKNTVNSQAFRWNAEKGWQSFPSKPDSQPATVCYFPLLQYKDQLANMHVDSVLKLTQAGFQTETVEDTCPVSDGQRAFYSLPEAVRMISFDGSSLEWERFGGNVSEVQVRLESNDSEQRIGTLAATLQTSGNWKLPDPVTFVVPRKGNPTITPTVILTQKDGSILEWKHNGIDLLTNRDLNPRQIQLRTAAFRVRQ